METGLKRWERLERVRLHGDSVSLFDENERSVVRAFL